MMNISQCCGAAVNVVYQSDHPHLYDDDYDLRYPIFTCAKCGMTITSQKENGYAPPENLDSE